MKALIIGMVALVLAAVAVSAHGMGRMGMGTYHDKMEKVLEEGTYEDLVSLRKDTGMPMMPWVTDEATFKLMQQHHAIMEKYRTAGGMGYGGMRMGCHYSESH